MKKHLLLSILAAATLTASAQKDNIPVETGQFTPDWESLDAWQCPEWFKNAKFGIWAHWGPQCQPEDGDWYARNMYIDGSGQNTYHWDTYGNPADYGFKDIIHDWKAENWDPERLINLYKSVGAKYFVALANHHDNFDLWDTEYQEWNSVDLGPQKNIIKGWSDACKKAGLPLGVSVHASHAWTWYEPSQEYDGNLTKADGTGKWWEGLDPQELYAQKHALSPSSYWDWGTGVSLPSDAYKQKFQNRVLELINKYDPSMIYFDDTALPFYGCDDAVGQNILADYYNHSAAENGGTPDVVVTGKQLTKDQKKHMLWDVERGIPDKTQDEYWQTCTCLGDWHYNKNVYNNGTYKSAQQVIDMLVDIVSKNGNMLLSVPVKADGTIDDKEEAILADIKAWMDVNSCSVYGTRPWKTFGEGPLAEESHSLSAQGFNEGNNYTAKDVAFCQRNDTLFATIMRWPSGSFTFESLGMSSEYYSGKVKSVKLIGYDGTIEYKEEVDGVTVTIPSTKPNELAPVFAFTFDENSSTVSLADIIDGYETKAKALLDVASYNTGKFSQKSVMEFIQVLSDAKKYESASESDQKAAIETINEAYKTLKNAGKNPGGNPEEVDGSLDITEDKLVEASNFSTSTMGSRFGTPANWTVENFYVPVSDTSKGVKNGIDAYNKVNELCLGVWQGEDVEPYSDDIANARIYRTVHLDAGRYYFGANFSTNYNVTDNEFIFAADKVLNTTDIEDQSIAYTKIADAGTGKFYGIYFTLQKEQDVVLGFQANMSEGSMQKEFRANAVKLIYYGNMDYDALDRLIMSADETKESAIVNSNTGYYKKEAVETLEKAIEAAQAISESSSQAEFTEAYNTLQQAVKDFQENGKNVGGAPTLSGCEDITIEKLHETENFARTAETDNGNRFGAAKYWTIDNFGLENGSGYQGGIDNNPGYDCLHLEVWWNQNSFTEKGYDLHNVRLYQLVDLAPGRYYFGASYPNFEPNEDNWIFASEELVSSDEITTKTIAYERTDQASRNDGSFRGIYFTLEEAKKVYLGWQADFSGVQTNNMRAKAIKLLYYGELTYEKFTELINDVEAATTGVKINSNTGYYSQTAYDEILSAIAAAKAVPSDADFDTLNEAYNALNDAYTNFKENGKNPGGQPNKIGATDLTEQYLVETSEFSRKDPSVTTRFATPAYWTVENFQIPNGGDGTKNGIDKNPGYSCLYLGLWDDRDKNEDGDLTNARLYRTVNLPAGTYYFGASYNTTYNLSSSAYIFAADQTMATSDIPTNSIAYYQINKASDNDGLFWGINFTLEKQQDVVLGFQADLANGAGEQEFRASKVVFYGYGTTDAIEDVTSENANAPVQIYSLQGIRMNSIPAKGFYIVRQGDKTMKYYKK